MYFESSIGEMFQYITGKPKLEIETFSFPDLMYIESNNGEMFQYIKSSLEISMKVSDFGMNTI